MNTHKARITNEFLDYIGGVNFPCVAAKAALAERQIMTIVVDHLACPRHDTIILDFLYGFVEAYRKAKKLFHSAAVIFTQPVDIAEDIFDGMLWRRLQAISDLDAQRSQWDERVARDAASPNFSYSINAEALYIVALHPNSSRRARQFHYPTFVFNPHAQFEQLRERQKYISIRNAVRKRDIKLTGSINPMLADFGESSEAIQYSGRQYEKSWQCPFIAHHERPEHHTSA